MSTAILSQPFFPALGSTERCFPEHGPSKPVFFESSRQSGNCGPCSLTSFFYFGGPQACACHLIYQIPNHYRRGFVARQTGLAQHLRRLTGFRKARVLAHGLLATSLFKAWRSIRFQKSSRISAAVGNCSQTARSSDVTVSHPNLNMYRPGSVTRPTCDQVTLLTANHCPFRLQPLVHRPLMPWRLLAFAYLNLCVVSVRQHLVERAHVERLPAARTLHEMVGFRFDHAIRVNPTILAGLRHRSRASFLYRQPTRGGFSTVGTIVTIHRCGLRDRSSWTDRTMPKIFDPFKLSSAARPLYWARRQRWASTELLVSTVCMMTSSGQPRTVSVKR
jgi:hypothetical protein